jgi:hypothetical protein
MRAEGLLCRRLSLPHGPLAKGPSQKRRHKMAVSTGRTRQRAASEPKVGRLLMGELLIGTEEPCR